MIKTYALFSGYVSLLSPTRINCFLPHVTIQSGKIWSTAEDAQPLEVTFQVPPADLISQFGLKLKRGKYDEFGKFEDSQMNFDMGDNVTIKLTVDQNFQYR